MVNLERRYAIVVSLVIGMAVFNVACESGYYNSRAVAPVPFQKGDICELCRMQTSDFRFSAEILLSNGKALKFDDAICLVQYFDMARKLDLSDRRKIAAYYFGDYDSGRLVRSDSAIFVRSANFAGVMGKLGSAIAFDDSGKAREFIKRYGGRFISFEDLW
ncbi:MAG: nitrous oxide reductase accessory protein NosL, partial [Candidatus Kryptoniota bacterium]